MNKPIKIVIGPAKRFNTTDISKNNRPKHIQKAKSLFKKYIKNLSLEQTKNLYKLSDKKSLEVYKMHQEHGQKIYNAIEVFGGTVFKQLHLNEYNKEWLNKHVLILDPLYGPLKPYDSIGLYRLDLTIKLGIDIKKYWKKEIEEELKGFSIINLSSKEYSVFLEGINDVQIPELNKEIKQIKKARGIKLNELILKHQNNI